MSYPVLSSFGLVVAIYGCTKGRVQTPAIKCQFGRYVREENEEELERDPIDCLPQDGLVWQMPK